MLYIHLIMKFLICINVILHLQLSKMQRELNNPKLTFDFLIHICKILIKVAQIKLNTYKFCM